MTRLITVSALVFLTACGVPGTTPVADLDDGQRTQVCEDALDAANAATPGEYDCGDGVTVTIEAPDATDQAECESGLQDFGTACPDLVVDDIIDCFDAQAAADPCSDGLPAECDAFFACLFSDM